MGILAKNNQPEDNPKEGEEKYYPLWCLFLLVFLGLVVYVIFYFKS